MASFKIVDSSKNENESIPWNKNKNKNENKTMRENKNKESEMHPMPKAMSLYWIQTVPITFFEWSLVGLKGRFNKNKN